MINKQLFLWGLITVGVFGCKLKDTAQPTLFNRMPSSHTNIDFINKLVYNKDFNIFNYRNFYNGGGVALGDINNDGLLDIYFTSNQNSNKLYLNKGRLHFEDITMEAGVGGTGRWTTGVTMADVNADGWLDIYVCNAGDAHGGNAHNELFINNKDNTFSEQGKQWGIADDGYSTHAAFFDFDNDGDLDLYVLNNAAQPIGNFNLQKDERPKRDIIGGDRLWRNDGDHFIDVSEQAGIYSSIIGFGLGVTTSDLNQDGWVDIYVSNDLFERDYLYINQKDGTFKEDLVNQVRSISQSSMGSDIADINNDGWPDIFVTDMLPELNERIKSVTTFQTWDSYQYNLSNDYYHQFARNSLQLNRGNNTFSEIGRMCGVEATDWSWGALMFDINNDGLKDIFVANGIYKDLTDQDYLQYVSNTKIIKSTLEKKNIDYEELIDAMPSHAIANYAFENQGELKFTNKANAWGLGTPGFSNGAAYGDLDNDGDMDLVINNVNSKADIYINQAESFFPKHRHVKFELKGEKQNTFAIGTRITLFINDNKFYVEQMPTRGFQSSVDPRPLVGVGTVDQIDSIIVQWPTGKTTRLYDVNTNQTIHLDETSSSSTSYTLSRKKNVIAEIKVAGLEFVHTENDFVDFNQEQLIFHMVSSEGPKICIGDVNKDGRDDIYIGGAKGQAGALLIQQTKGNFKRSHQTIFELYADAEDTDCLFFDADSDGDQDLYVGSGGNELTHGSAILQDRLYFNDGKGNFTMRNNALPAIRESTSCIAVADIDEDGDNDLFVGIRAQPYAYGLPVSGYILQNDGNGVFNDITRQTAPVLNNLGMITDAHWVDVDKDNDLDLMLVGDWMPLTLLRNENGRWSNKSADAGLSETNGWWNALLPCDIDNDGDIDFIAGNHGLNSKFKGSKEEPVVMFTKDFDGNGSIEQIICTYEGLNLYPMVLRHDLVAQINALKKKYLKYDRYKNETIYDIFSKKELEDAFLLRAFEFRTSLLLNEKGKFLVQPLPKEAQFAPIYAILFDDMDGDGHNDIFLGGNLYRTKPEAGRYDASYGLIMQGDGKGDFHLSTLSDVGIKGEIRDIKTISISGKKVFLTALNNDSLKIFQPSDSR